MQVMCRHSEQSIFQINTCHRHSLLNNFKDVIKRFNFKMLIIYIMVQMFQIYHGPEGTIFPFSGENCRNKVPSLSFTLLSFYDNTFSWKFLNFCIYNFCFYFISCPLCRILGAGVIPGLSWKLIFRPFIIVSRITLSRVFFCHSV